jgi:glycerol-3-phosphate dehydrogenase
VTLWDVLVVGGGATGLGTAVDAATRGLTTLLLEARDFAQGTSSRSTKLVHGGVRYLAQGQVSLVREALRERGRLLRNAPHVVHERAFLVPAYAWWERPYYGIGLWAYDRLAGRLGFERSRGVGRDEAIRLAPTIEPANLWGGTVYHDGQFDDARLAVALARTLDDARGTALNHVEVTGLTRDGAGKINGADARDAETGETFAVRARAVVNATGVFADTLRRFDDPAAPPMLAPSQGAHVVLPREFLPGETAVLVPKTDDGRVLFAIPWLDRVLVGTTDTPVARAEVEPRPLPEEVEFLLRHAARYLTRDPSPSDALSAFAGLRPLIDPGHHEGGTAKISREHAVVVSRSGLVTITGGKWTTYRAMAESAVDTACRVAGLPARPCTTAELRLHGAPERPEASALAFYGTDALAVERLIAEKPGWSARLHDRLPYRLGEVAWAARHESARTVEDVLARRLRALFLDARASAEAAPAVAEVLGAEFGRGEDWRSAQVESFRRLANGYMLTNGDVQGPGGVPISSPSHR